MRILLALSIVFVSLSLPARAQTTGVPGINDYTVFGSTSGSTSCNRVTIPASTAFTLDVSAGPNLPVAVVVSFCPCRPGATLLAPTSCAVPFTAGSGTTNQSLDIAVTPACTPLILFGVTDSLGNLSIPVSGTLPPMTFSTQAVILDPSCATSSIPGVVSQAYDVVIL